MNAAMEWINFKLDLEALTGLEKDALHIYAAVALQIAVALVTRRTLGSWLPVAVVAGAAIVNEWADLSFSIWPDRGWQYRESIHDIVNTMLLPIVLLGLARFSPRLFGPQPPEERAPDG